MRLVQLSIQRYRSIIDTERLRLQDLTVLVGPNNEGKSNILQALVTSMRTLSQGGAIRRPSVGRRFRGDRLRGDYDWLRDFPRALQDSKPDGRSILNLDFELNGGEIDQFEQTVGSRLNGILPVGLSFGPDNRPAFTVRKQRHSAALSARRAEIEAFIADHVHLQYIPATRTADAALEVVDDMIRAEFVAAETTNEEYRAALDRIQAVQREILDAMETTICASLGGLLPDVRRVSLELEPDRLRPRARSRVVIDDGTATDLEFKGDGVQSLAALSLIRQYSQEGATGRELILAVEEPEAHLHPKAIHEIGAVLRQTASLQQVVISTHSPLLVNRFNLAGNIIVEKARARVASSVADLRAVLGVRTSDNLEHAEVILIVEGPEDEVALRAIIGHRSQALRTALGEGTLAIQPLFGGAKLTYVLSLLNSSMCRVHAFLDNDSTGRNAATRAREEGLLDAADETFAAYAGAQNSEIEDLYRVDVYSEALSNGFGFDVARLSTIPRSKGKWSQRLRLLFQSAGKRWDDEVERTAKALVAESVAGAPQTSIDPRCDAVVAGLTQAIEAKLAADGTRD
jgi:putative ATP-dependent endonuclease of the OLD family